MKEAYYFSHDTNAIQDPKLMALLKSCGLAGIGMYWILIEVLHQQDDGTITEDELKTYIDFYTQFDGAGIGEHEQNQANKLHIEQMLIKCSALVKQNGKVFSKRVLDNKKLRDEISQKRSEAGKASGLKRAKNQSFITQKLTSVQQMFNKNEQTATKEIKGKEIKIKESEYITPIKENMIFQISQLESELLNAFTWIESTAKYLNTTPENIKSHIPEFVQYLPAIGETEKDLKDAQSHFTHWFNKKFKTKAAGSSHELLNDQLWIEQVANKYQTTPELIKRNFKQFTEAGSLPSTIKETKIAFINWYKNK